MIRRNLCLSLFAICVVAFSVLFLCPSSASAVTPVTEMSPTGKSWPVGTDLRCQFLDPNTGVTKVVNGSIYGECNNPPMSQLTQPLRLNSIYLNTDIDIVEGNYYTTYFQFSTNDFLNNVLWNINTTNADFNIVKFETVVQQTMGNGVEGANGPYAWTTTIYEVVLQAKRTGKARFILGNTAMKPETLSVDYNGQYSLSGVYEYKAGGPTAAIEAQTKQQHEDAQAALNESKKQTDIAEEQKNFVTSTDTPEASDIANSDSLPSVGLLPSGPLDSLLLLPLNIMNSIFSSLGGSCSPVVAPLPYVDQDVTFPCFGDTIYKGSFAPLNILIGSVGSALILFYYFKHLYKKVDRATSLETTDDDEWGIL